MLNEIVARIEAWHTFPMKSHQWTRHDCWYWVLKTEKLTTEAIVSSIFSEGTQLTWCKNLLCHFPFFSEACSHFWSHTGICQKSFVSFGIIFLPTASLLHRGTTISIALSLDSFCFSFQNSILTLKGHTYDNTVYWNKKQ